MGAILLILFASSAALRSPSSTPAPAQADTSAPFDSPAVQRLVDRAIARRERSDSAVEDYRATIRYRLSVGVGQRRWASIPTTAVEEQVARVQWQRPNDLRVDVVGRRFRARSDAFELSSVWDRPWFVPRAVDDSVRIFSNDFPATGALHPLAPTGPQWYRYRSTGELTVAPPRGEPLRLIRIEVTPRRGGPALIAGQLWIDSATAEVARLTFRYVGTGLWVRPEPGRGPDSTKARKLNALANRIVSIDADLEYALQEGRYWMPYRQVIAGRVQLPIVGETVIPFRAVTTFDDYEINGGRPIAFEVPLPDTSGLSPDSAARLRRARLDSLQAERQRRNSRTPDSLRAWNYADRWPGGRYELHRPANVTLDRYRDWPDSLRLEDEPADLRRLRETEVELERLARTLPDSLTGVATHGIAFQHPSDAMRYDRVQGISFGLGYQTELPGIEFTRLYGLVRYGASDERVTGRISLVRDAPGGRLSIAGYRDLVDVDPFSPGHTIGNTLNALFVAHDDADYALAHGASASFVTSLATGLDLTLSARVERQRDAPAEAVSAVNDFLGGDGRFPPNAPVDTGTFVGGAVRLAGTAGTRWSITADVLGGGGRATGRLFGDLRRNVGGRSGATVRLKAGLATAPTLAQSQFRLGGPATVRGFDYGIRRGQSFWAAQLDVTPLRSRIRPVAFVDAGQSGSPEELFGSEALVGGGVGLSLLRGFVRFDLSWRLAPDAGGPARLDITVQAVR